MGREGGGGVEEREEEKVIRISVGDDDERSRRGDRSSSLKAPKFSVKARLTREQFASCLSAKC